MSCHFGVLLCQVILWTEYVRSAVRGHAHLMSLNLGMEWSNALVSNTGGDFIGSEILCSQHCAIHVDSVDTDLLGVPCIISPCDGMLANFFGVHGIIITYNDTVCFLLSLFSPSRFCWLSSHFGWALSWHLVSQWPICWLALHFACLWGSSTSCIGHDTFQWYWPLVLLVLLLSATFHSICESVFVEGRVRF